MSLSDNLLQFNLHMNGMFQAHNMILAVHVYKKGNMHQKHMWTTILRIVCGLPYYILKYRYSATENYRLHPYACV